MTAGKRCDRKEGDVYEKWPRASLWFGGFAAWNPYYDQGSEHVGSSD